MFKEADFPSSNLQNLHKIVKPAKSQRQQEKRQERPQSQSTKVVKSFNPQQKSVYDEVMRKDIENLKKMLKKENEEQKKKKELFMEGKISRQQFEERQKNEVKKEEPSESEKVNVDDSGQITDKHGNHIFVKQHKTLGINKKKDRETQEQKLAKIQRIKFHQRISKVFVDPNVRISSNKKRIRRNILGLQFLEKGSYQPAQAKQEVKMEADNLNDIFDHPAVVEHDVIGRISKRHKKINLQFTKDVPEVEWWDQRMLEQGIDYHHIMQHLQYQDIDKLNPDDLKPFINFGEIGDQTNYQRVGENEEANRVMLPMYLTKEERKKLKRKRKREKLLEKNDKIKLGLIEPEKPKLRVGNMAIVMKNQFILDPSKIESEARKQTQERVNGHLESNRARKLTKTQKKDKVMRKLKRDSAKQCRRAVFKVRNLHNQSHFFKVTQNAKQLVLNGFVVKPCSETIHQPCLVMVEGGARAVRFYKNLMLNRIKWDEEDQSNRCDLLWEGQIENTTAGKWKVVEVGDEVQAIRFLSEKKMEGLWDHMM